MPTEQREGVTRVRTDRPTGKPEEPLVLTEGGSLQWVARAGYVERHTSGSVSGSG
jgi:hypothetical protein